MNMHEYTVEFRIYGKGLDTSAISRDLGLSPSLIIEEGDAKGKSEQFAESVWACNGCADAKSWDSLEEGLTFLLEKLAPVRQKIDTYRSKYQLILWCGHFQSSANGGPLLSPSLLKSLAEFGVEVFIDNYLSSEG